MKLWIQKNKVHVRILTFALVSIIFLSANGFFTPTLQVRNVSAQTISTCLNRVNIPLDQWHWIYVPESADELYTEEDHFYLAGKLISNKVVDASACPAGGLTLNGYANACGIDVARPTTIIVQNMLNEPILQAYKDIGVPPILLKQLIRVESVFWPSKYDEIHYGYGHIINIGMRSALEWNPNLAAKVCPNSAYGACASSIETADEILASLIATCPTCKYGIDPVKANRSVDVLAEVVLGYCYQTTHLVYNATGWHSSWVVDYGTIWKLTLMDYNAGSECVYKTVAATFEKTQGPMSWSEISANVSGDLCLRGLNYANQVTAKVYDFSLKE